MMFFKDPEQNLSPISKACFYTCTISLTVFGGFLALIGIPFRPIFVIPLIFVALICEKNFTFKRNFPAISVALMLIVLVFVSLMVNHSEISSALLFSRNIIMPLLMSMYLETSSRYFNFKKIKSFMILIACIQLPIILLQRHFYHQIITTSKIFIYEIDIGFGTFFPSCDPTMTLYLIGIILWIVKSRNEYKPKHLLLLSYLTISIFFSNSEASKLAFTVVLLFVLPKVVLTFNFFQKGILCIITATILLSTLFSPWINNTVFAKLLFFSDELRESVQLNSSNIHYQKFYNGEYARSTAVHHFISQPVSLLGAGPGTIVNPMSDAMKLSVHGHLLTFYAELGVIGLLLSFIFTYFLMPSRKTFTNILFFVSLLMISYTVNFTSDTSFLFVFFLISNLLAPVLTPVAED